jgi:hypothetical protein
MKASPLKEIKQENSEAEKSGSSVDQVECSIIYNIAKDSVVTIKRPEGKSGIQSNETSGKGLMVGGTGAKPLPKKMISTDDSNLVGVARLISKTVKETMSRRNSVKMESRLGMVYEVNLFKEPGSSEELNKYFSDSELEGSENESYKEVLKRCVNLARESSGLAGRPIKFTMPESKREEDSVHSMSPPKLSRDEIRDPASYERYHYDKAKGKGDCRNCAFEFSEMECGPMYSERFGSEQFSTNHLTPNNIVRTKKSGFGVKSYQETKTSDTTNLQACYMTAKSGQRPHLKQNTDLSDKPQRDSSTPKSQFYMQEDTPT